MRVNPPKRSFPNSDQLSQKLRGQSHEGLVNVARWLSRTTLDIVDNGKHTSLNFFVNAKTQIIDSYLNPTSLDYDFGALEDKENELVSAFKNLLQVAISAPRYQYPSRPLSSIDCAMYPATWNSLFKALSYYIPTCILNFLEYIPTKKYRRFRAFNYLTKGIANQLVQDKGSDAGDEENKTVMSLLSLFLIFSTCKIN